MPTRWDRWCRWCAVDNDTLPSEIPGRVDWLVLHWESADPPDRESMLEACKQWSNTERWAWDGLIRLSEQLNQQKRPFPPRLAHWLVEVAKGERKRPRAVRNADRDMRIVAWHQSIRTVRRISYEEAAEEVARVFEMEMEAILKVLHRQSRRLRDHPFT